MSYSISFLPPAQAQQSAGRDQRSSSSRRNATMAGVWCQESRVYLDKLNDQQKALVKPLISRVEHWKGHCLCSFGKPLLQAKVTVSRSPLGGNSCTEAENTRQYQIFLFSNILVCCRKRSRPNAQGKDWTLKGRVFLRNIYDVQQTGDMQLRISYHGDDGSDTFTINFARPALLARWSTVLDHFRQCAAEPRALEEGSPHSEIPPPAYYSPLPEYTSSSRTSLSAPAMERHSPLNTPLSSPPLYTPSETFPSDQNVRHPSQYPCRPVMATSLSASSIGSASYDQDDLAVSSYNESDAENSYISVNKMEHDTYFLQPVKYACALVSTMATASGIYQALAFTSICLYLAYLGLSQRAAGIGNGSAIEVF